MGAQSSAGTRVITQVIRLPLMSTNWYGAVLMYQPVMMHSFHAHYEPQKDNSLNKNP